MMFVLGNLLMAVSMVTAFVLKILWWLVVIRALLSWVSPDPYNPIVQFIERSTEPILAPFRRLVPAWRIGLDLSPILALLFLYFLEIFLVQTLTEFALRLQ